MIQSICIEYKQIGSESDWKLYKYVSVYKDESETSEIILLRDAFGIFFDFRVVVYATEPLTIKEYSSKVRNWIEK